MNDKNPTPEEIPFPIDASVPSHYRLWNVQWRIMSGKLKLWEDARFVCVDVPINSDEAGRILPLFMFLRKPYRATLFIAHYPKTAFTRAYNECALLIHVRTPFGSGVHCPWMIVDDDTALIYGREILGYPKKMGKFSFKESGKKITASLDRKGTTVLSLEADRKRKEDKPTPVMARKSINVGGMGQFFAFNPIWMFKPREVIHDSSAASVKLNLKHSDYDPIKKLVADFTNPLEARVATIDIHGARFLWYLGFTGLKVFKNSYNLRFR